MKRKRILIFSNVKILQSDLKGTGNWIIRFIDELESLNIYNIFIAFHENQSIKIKSEKVGRITIIRIPYFSKNKLINRILSGWLIVDKYRNSLKNYLQVIDLINPDIIQIFGLESPFIRILKSTKIPVVVHIQGLIAPYLLKYFPRFTNYEIVKARGVLNLLAGNIPFIEKKGMMNHLKIENDVYSSIKFVLGRTEWDKRCAKALVPKAKYFHCQEIMRDSFYKNFWQPKEGKEIVLYTTIKDVFYKNVDIIFETCEIMEKHHNIFFVWRIGGVTKEDITPKIMRMRKKHLPSIVLLGPLNVHEIIKEILNANIFVYPSSIENGCNAVQEAMLLGIPIIACYSGGLTTTLQDKISGVLVNEGDPFVLAGAIIEMVENYSKAIELGNSARRIALERHNPKDIINDVKTIYNLISDGENERSSQSADE